MVSSEVDGWVSQTESPPERDDKLPIFFDAKMSIFLQRNELIAHKDNGMGVRSEPEQPSQQPMTFAGKGIFAPVEIREINWATHFLPKIDPAAKSKDILEAYARPNPVEEHCLLVLNSAWEEVSSKMYEYDKWAHFRIETELVSELLERRMLVLYKMYEMELKTKVDEHRANFDPDVHFANYDHMCIRFLDRELKVIIMQHRALRLLAGLPLLVPESSVAGSTRDDILQITWTVGRITSKQGTTLDQEAERQPAKEAEQRILAIEHQAHAEEQPAPKDEETVRIEQQAQEKIDEISHVVQNVEESEAEAETVNSQEHHAQDEEHQAQATEHRAQDEELPTQADEQQAHEQHAQEEPAQQAEQEVERQAQAGSSHSSPSCSSSYVHFPTSDANNEDHQGHSPSGLQMVRYTADGENNSDEDEEDFAQAGPQPINFSRPQADLMLLRSSIGE
ncbi:hypothetical protein F511_24842 [Dorcoceras hygrometricum]|uniref:Uncharacterized protein n=1 Tax=Dorcoceras hygrometricum TaxID=472368 RepID=A0A2Z7ALY0_9LAMI|nr:hypothetical protein F511_24842 [Dorcoceras hygrometricum]